MTAIVHFMGRLPLLPDREHSRFRAYVAAARARPDLWRVGIGIVAIVSAFIALPTLILRSVLSALNSVSPDTAAAIISAFQETPQRWPLLISLFGFLAPLLALLGVAIVLHKRGLASLVGFRGRILWTEWAQGAVAVVMMAALALPVAALLAPPVQQIPVSVWIWFLLPALLAIFVQTLAEELLFRGYLQQQLAARYDSAWIWWFGPALLFGLAHGINPLWGENVWLVIVATTLMGLALGHLTAATGNISAAAGAHFANNVIAILLFAYPGPLSGLSLALAPLDLDDVAAVRLALTVNIGIILLLYLTWLVALNRRRLS